MEKLFPKLLFIPLFFFSLTISFSQNTFNNVRVTGYSHNSQCNVLGDGEFGNPEPNYIVTLSGEPSQVIRPGAPTQACGSYSANVLLASSYSSPFSRLTFTIVSWEEDLCFSSDEYNDNFVCSDDIFTNQTFNVPVRESNGSETLTLANGYTITVSWGDVILPVKLTSFEGEAMDNQLVKLEWTTASEINNSHFDIERQDATGEFYKIGEVSGAGDSSGEINYSFIDGAPAKGENLYRLRQVDFDLDFEYSDIITVDVNFDGAKVNFFPNPVTSGQFTIVGIAAGKIKIVDLSGQILLEQEVTNGQVINTSDLKRGFYILSVENSKGETSQHKMVIQ